MKNEKFIPVQGEEDLAVSEVRRKEYALTRDQQALEYNEAIAKRIILIEKNIIKCDRCGKEFSANNASDQKSCPECAER